MSNAGRGLRIRSQSGFTPRQLRTDFSKWYFGEALRIRGRSSLTITAKPVKLVTIATPAAASLAGSSTLSISSARVEIRRTGLTLSGSSTLVASDSTTLMRARASAFGEMSIAARLRAIEFDPGRPSVVQTLPEVLRAFRENLDAARRGASTWTANRPRVVAKRVAAFSLANAVTTALGFDSEDYDVAVFPMHDNVTNPQRITIQSAGHYLIIGAPVLDPSAATCAFVVLNKNGSGVAVASTKSTGVIANAFPVMWLDVCAAGDYFDLVIYQNSGGAVSLNVVYSSFAAIQLR